jgi:hypothetical protein
LKNLKGDALWAAVLAIWVLMLVVPESRELFIETTTVHPYMGGFVKFSILASMGDLLGGRILNDKWEFPEGFLMKAVVWGVLGMMTTLAFTVFTLGAAEAQYIGRLPFAGSVLANAVFGSIIMNATFGPMLYVYHKFGNLFVEAFYENKKSKSRDAFSLKTMAGKVDWYNLVSFSWLNNCICIWMPCHTLVFLLPMEYRVLASAFLSILLGVLVAVSKKISNGYEPRLCNWRTKNEQHSI